MRHFVPVLITNRVQPSIMLVHYSTLYLHSSLYKLLEIKANKAFLVVVHLSRQFDVWTTLQSVRILELNFPDFCSNNKLSCKTRSTVWRTSILAIFQYCLEEKKKLQFASQHCARAHTLGQDSIFWSIIEFRSKCEFFAIFSTFAQFRSRNPDFMRKNSLLSESFVFSAKIQISDRKSDF